ncbi:2-vinyl bacteriochlorophyllide hydratase [Acidiphilium sp.]|uniref:2-vinyl bacteriochlorophyllide hydratase n=1 Tax=Acidiphilium sp. TaxID=527 RepID=UPI003D03A20C
MTASVNCCPWEGHAYGMTHDAKAEAQPPGRRTPFLYSLEERRRRDATPWTMVQGILAPIQFLVFLVSLSLVARYLITGDGLAIATDSILVKTVVLFTIMITGAIWEHAVFGKYLFARAFFWEDVFSMLVIGLHSLYVLVLFTHLAGPQIQMMIALAAYATYVFNAMQFVMKLRAARLEAPRHRAVTTS